MIDDPFELDDDFTPPEPRRPAGPPPWLEGLNPEQHEAVTTTDGPLLVLSGAGTGKTRVLTTRLAHILGTGKAQPWRILAVTFTNRAAKEMRERVSAVIGPMADQVWLGTFHALAAKMLRRDAEVVGLSSNFTILDSDDQNRVLKALMEDRSIDTKKWAPNVVMSVIQRWKDRGWTPENVPREQHGGDIANGRTLELYTAYQARLLELNVADFGDLLLHVLTLFKKNPDILRKYQQQFQYILVDEYQDTNASQFLWLRLLSQVHRNICCVGDDDQSIYSWRGAEVSNILGFEQHFPGAGVVRLESNYRSTPTILGAASGLIRNNSGRLGKDLRAAGNVEAGEKVTVYSVWDGQAEARWVVDQMEAMQRAKVPLSQMAVLVRAGFLTREFEERLITTGTPYRVIGGLRFYERQEIRDAVAYLRLIEQPADDLAFERIINTPRRGLADASLQVLHLAAKAQGVGLMAAARSVLDTDELKPKARASLAKFVDDIDRWASLRDAMDVAELIGTVLDESGYMAMWKADKTPAAPGRVENLQELVAALEGYASLSEFLEHISLVMENDNKAEQGDAVTLMTLHAAKGLEFDVVFLPAWEEEIFPNRRSLDESGSKALEEERRLAYVGLTRARRKVFISHASSRRVYNQWQSNTPSRFIAEIPDVHKEEDSESGLTAGSRGFSEAWSSWNGGWDGKAGGGAANSGWQQRKQRFTSEREGLSYQAARREPAPDSAVPARGERVFHDKFGYGQVLACEGDKLTVAFDKAGQKKVMAGFVQRADEV